MDINVNEPLIKSTGESTVEMNKEMRTYIILSINKLVKESKEQEHSNKNHSQKNIEKEDKIIFESLKQPMIKYLNNTAEDLKKI